MTPMNTASLSGMSVELLECIAEQLSTIDLLSFRLASADIASKLEWHLAKTRFEELHVLARDWRSIICFRNICEHPTFRKAVRKIYFNPAKLRHKGGLCIHKFVTQDCPSCGKRDFVIPEESANDFLASALGSFCASQRVPAIGAISEPVVGGPKPLGHDSSTIVLDYYAKEFCGRLMNDNLMRAIQRSGFPAADLALGCRFYPLELEYLPRLCAKNVVTNLRVLDLYLQKPKEDFQRDFGDVDRERIEAAGATLRKLVCVAKGLEVFKLKVSTGGYVRSHDGNLFAALARGSFGGSSKPLASVRELTLEGHRIPRRLLLEFLHDRRQTLKKIVLCNILDDPHAHPDIKQDIETALDRDDLVLALGKVYDPSDYGYD